MPATLTKPTLTDFVLGPARRTLGYAEKLVADIPADKFGHMPHPTMNHPAFCMGHLSLYPNRLFTLIGQPNKISEKKGWPELFQSGVACVEDDGRYPKKDEIVAFYVERYNAIIKTLETTSEEMYARENPMEGRMKEVFPFIGLAINFMLNNHAMMHLGQVSAWRRAMGLPGVM